MAKSRMLDQPLLLRRRRPGARHRARDLEGPALRRRLIHAIPSGSDHRAMPRKESLRRVRCSGAVDTSLATGHAPGNDTCRHRPPDCAPGASMHRKDRRPSRASSRHGWPFDRANRRSCRQGGMAPSFAAAVGGIAGAAPRGIGARRSIATERSLRSPPDSPRAHGGFS